MANGFIVTKEDWEHMSPAQQSWMTFNSVRDMNARVSRLEKRSLFDKVCSTVGGIIGGFLAFLGVKLGG